MKRLLLFFSILCLSSSALSGQGQEKEKWTEKIDVSRFPHRDSVRRELETIPAFGIYKDNYFVTGTNFQGGGINKDNSDAKFQVSIMHRLIKGILPHEMYVFLTYSQRSFWDIYKKSAPFAETVYNPSLGVGNKISALLRAAGRKKTLRMAELPLHTAERRSEAPPDLP